MSLDQAKADGLSLRHDDLLRFEDSRYLLGELYLAPPGDEAIRADIDYCYDVLRGVVQEGRSLVLKADLGEDKHEADYYLTPEDVAEFCQWTGSLGVATATGSRLESYDPWPSTPDMP